MTDLAWLLTVLVVAGVWAWVGYGIGYDRGMAERDKTWDEMYERYVLHVPRKSWDGVPAHHPKARV